MANNDNPTQPFSAHASGAYDAVVSQVRGFGRYRRRWSALQGLAWFVLLGPGALLVWFAADWAVHLPPWPLVGLFAAIVALGLWAAAWKVARPLLRRVRPQGEALRIERLHGRLDNRIIGSLQLGQEVLSAADAPSRLGYEPHLVWALVAQTQRLLSAQDVRRLLDLRQARRMLAAAGGVAVAIVLCVVLARPAVLERMQRLADAYAAVLDSLFSVEMTVTPGNVAVVRGRPVELAVAIPGARRQAVRLLRRELKSKKETADELLLAGGRSALRIDAAGESFDYQFEYGGRKSGSYRVAVESLPAIGAINYELTYPAYTGQAPRTLVGQVTRLGGLTGTGVVVSLAATTELSPDLCYVQWQDGQKQQLSVSGRFAHFSFTIDRPARAAIYLTGALGRGFEMEQPASFEVVMQRDEPPTIRALLTKKKLTMLPEEAAAFGVKWLAEDDFGVAEVGIQYKIDTIDPLLNRPLRESSQARRIDPPSDHVSDQFLDVFKGLTPPLAPGDRITITLAAKDNNDTEGGPGMGRSQPIEIVIVQSDLAEFTEKQFGFGAASLLGGLKKIERSTDLLIEPQKSVRTEAAQKFDKQDLKARVSQDPWPSGSEDAVADYFKLLSGGR